MKEEKKFETESRQLLDLMINSIYSNQEIFLRELISNASDAIDKYKYLSLTESTKYPQKSGEIRLTIDKAGKNLTIQDNGIGMNKEDLEKNLGTIAKSGSKEFLEKFKEAKDSSDLSIIGQFGVGFYSAFMVGKRIEVLTKTIDGEAYLFSSDGKETYSIEEASFDVDSGTKITIYLKDDEEDRKYSNYLEEYEITSLVKKYSDYIRYPIKMLVSKKVASKENEDDFVDEVEDKTLNSMIPLWKKNPKEVTDEELNNFYKDKFSDYVDPLTSVSLHLEGLMTYDALLFIPSHLPMDIYSDSYEKGLALYSKGIFIKDKCKELLPDYLKFVKGLVDSEDFSLNISREMLQSSPLLNKMSSSIEKKIIDKLKSLKKDDEEKYNKFFKLFGSHLKFGIYESYGIKKDLLEDLLIFDSTNKEGKIDLETYVNEMGKDQKDIFYASGKNLEEVKSLPQLEVFKNKGINVLLLTDPVDEFALSMMNSYKEKKFKNISSDTSLDTNEEEKKEIEELTILNKRILDTLQEGIKDKVDEVKLSSKLVSSPCCISNKDEMSLNMERILKDQREARKEDELPDMKANKVLEINPHHELFKALSNVEDEEVIKKYAKLFYDEAMLLEGIEIEDKAAFVSNLNSLLTK